MKRHSSLDTLSLALWATVSFEAVGQNAVAPAGDPAVPAEQFWNWHVQNTDIFQYKPAFPAAYSARNSLAPNSEIKNTESVDIMLGARLWRGAEVHADALVWQGFGLGETLGVDNFPSGEAYRVGTYEPNINLCRFFIRQTFGFGGEQESIGDDGQHLASKVDISRLTVTVGKMSAKDIFDNNTYANDPRTQFMAWGLAADEAWDYPADSLGYQTGIALELNQPKWTYRYGFYQVPKYSNGLAQDENYLKAWSMVTEVERRWTLGSHPGALRGLAYLEQAHEGSYADVVKNPALSIQQTRAYRNKYGFGLNAEQEVCTNVGVFTRLGWSDGRNEAWAFADVDCSWSGGFSIKGAFWGRSDDTFAAAAVFSGLSSVHQRFFEAGGTGILAGDGRLTYAWEKSMETYYDFQIIRGVHATTDIQFIADPSFNQERGPIYVISARLHLIF